MLLPSLGDISTTERFWSRVPALPRIRRCWLVLTGRFGAWTYRASRRRLADRRNGRRATLVEFLIARRNGQVRMGDVELLVEVREFASGILQEKAATDGQGRSE